MNADRDEIRIVQTWLEDGVTALPDRVLDAVIAQLPATKQVRPYGGLTRYMHMTMSLPGSARLAVIAAAAASVAVVGFAVLSKTDVGVQPTPSPSPTASIRSLTGRATDTTVPPGTYSVNLFPGSFELTLGPGWHSLSNGTGLALILRTEGGKPFGQAPNTVLLGAYVLGDLFHDPCREMRPSVKRPTTVEAAVTALRKQVGFTMTPVTTTLLGDRPAVTFEMDNSLSGSCPVGRAPHQLTYMTSPGQFSNVNNLGPGGHERFWLVQESGAVVAIVAYSGPRSDPTAADELAELYRVAGSIRFR